MPEILGSNRSQSKEPERTNTETITSTLEDWRKSPRDANGISSKSPWANNVVLDEIGMAHSFAVDYRKLNDVTKKDAYSLSDIQTILSCRIVRIDA